MIPYLLAVVGGYLLGDSMKHSEKFARGGVTDESQKKAKKFVELQKLANEQIEKNGQADEKTVEELEKVVDSMNSHEAEIAIEMWTKMGEKMADGGKVKFNDKDLLKKYNQGKSIGFTAIAHLKSKGLIPRADGTKRKTMADGGVFSFFRKPTLTESDKQKIIGNPINFKNFEIAENDFFEKMDFKEAVRYCKLLGEGWRLPTLEEFENIERSICGKSPNNQWIYDDTIVNLLKGLKEINIKSDCYWITWKEGDYKTLTEISWAETDGRAQEVDAAWAYDFEVVRNGFLRRHSFDYYMKKIITDKNYVRAVRSI